MSLQIPATVITVTHNSEAVLEHFAPRQSPLAYEWIVVDNASSDASAKVAASRGAKVVQLPANVGFSAANNAGAELAINDVLVFCNPDVQVTEEGLRLLVGRLMAEGGIVGPQLLNLDGSLQENGRGTPFFWRKVLHLLGAGSRAQTRYHRVAEHGETVPVVWLMGAAVAMRRETFDALGGWDSGFFIYYEDSDLCLRALHLGVPVRLDGSVRWVHGWARATARGFSWRAWRFEIRSAIRFYAKHPYCLLPVGRRSRLVAQIDRSRATT